MVTWLNNGHFCRNQIVGISMHQTEVNRGTSMFTVFYREASIIDSEVPMASITVMHFDELKSWDDLVLYDAETLLDGKGVLALVHCPGV